MRHVMSPENNWHLQTNSTMRYLVASVTGADRIGGRNESVDIPVGTVFTRVAKCRVDGDPMNLRTVDLGDVAEVRIQLLAVEHFGIRIDHVPADHSPTLFVDDARGSFKTVLV